MHAGQKLVYVVGSSRAPSDAQISAYVLDETRIWRVRERSSEDLSRPHQVGFHIEVEQGATEPPDGGAAHLQRGVAAAVMLA